MATEKAPETVTDETPEAEPLQGKLPEDPQTDAETAKTEQQPDETPDPETQDEAKEPEEPQLTPEEEEAAAAKRSEAAKKGAATRAANQAQAQLVEDVYKHLRHTIGAEVSIDQARVIVEMVQAPAAAE